MGPCKGCILAKGFAAHMPYTYQLCGGDGNISQGCAKPIFQVFIELAMEEIKKNFIKRDLIIAFLIGFAVASIIFTLAMMAMGTALHIAQNHPH